MLYFNSWFVKTQTTYKLFYTIYKTTQYAITMNAVKQSIHAHNVTKLTRLPATDLTRGATVTFYSHRPGSRSVNTVPQ